MMHNTTNFTDELPYHLLNDLTLKTVVNKEILGKHRNWVGQGLLPTLSSRNKAFGGSKNGKERVFFKITKTLS